MVTPHMDGTFRILERERENTRTRLKQNKTSNSNDRKSEATIAVFVDGNSVRSDAISLTPIPPLYKKIYQEKIIPVPMLLKIEPRAERKIGIQYHLDFLGASDSGVSKHLDVISYLKKIQVYNRASKLDDEFGSIFLRHLEHIFSFSIITSQTSEREAQISFIQDPTLEFGSTALNDL